MKRIVLIIILSLNASIYSKNDPFGILEFLEEIAILDAEKLAEEAQYNANSPEVLLALLAQCDKIVQQRPQVEALLLSRERIQKLYNRCAPIRPLA